MQEKRIEKSTKTRPVIHFPSLKMGRSLYCESRLEALACLMREFDPEISKYVTQPASYILRIEGKERRYTPDAVILNTDGTYFFEEVKPISALRSPTKKAHLEIKKKVFEKTSKTILRINTVYEGNHQETLTGNMSYLYRHLNWPPSKTTLQLLNSIPLGIEFLVHEIPTSLHLTHHFYNCIANGYISVDLEKKFSLGSKLRRIK